MLANTDKQKAKGLAKHAEHPDEACKTGSPSWKGEFMDLCRVLTTSPMLFPCCPFQEMQIQTEGDGKGNFPSCLVGFVP